MTIIEPGDLIQVWIKGGYCLWGNIQPVVHPKGSVVMIVDTEPLPDTVTACEAAGVIVTPTSTTRKLERGALVTIPQEAIDVIFGDDRHG